MARFLNIFIRKPRERKCVKIRVSVESLVLVIICMADMLSTLFFVTRGSAVEQNPLMAACLRRGVAVFVAMKVISFVPFVIAIELYRKYGADFARLACRSAIALYLLAFVTLTIGINYS